MACMTLAQGLSAQPRVAHVQARRHSSRRCCVAPRAAAAAAAAGDATAASRRALLLGGLALALAPPAARAAIVDDIGYEDRSNTRLPGECAFGEEGQACRMAALNDASSLGYEAQQKVGTTAGGNRGTVTANGAATRNAAADDKYTAATGKLLGEVNALLALDVYDPARAASIEAFKKDGNAWVGAYAPGGSSKKASGRAFYNALNQLQGHYAFNGLAPLPRATLDKVTRNLAETQAMLDSGR